MSKAQIGAAIVFLILASAGELQAQTCAREGMTNIFSDSTQVAVVNSATRPYAHPEQIAEGREFWNLACKGGGGVDYPLLTDTPTARGGVIQVEYHPGLSEQLNSNCDCHPVAEWHAENSTIVLYGEWTRPGEPTVPLVPDYERDGVRIIAHELGHALGLGHYPNTPECTSVPSIMQPSYSGGRDVFPEDCELLDRQHPMPGEGCPAEICTYTLRGRATMPPYSYTSVDLTAGFTSPGTGGVTSFVKTGPRDGSAGIAAQGNDTIENGTVTETVTVASDQTEFAFSTILADGTTYGVTPTVPDQFDCFLSFANGTVSGADPQELLLFCANKIPTFCDLYPRACAEAGYNDPDDVPWTIIWNCQTTQVEVGGYQVPCTDPETGEEIPGTCFGDATVTEQVCDFCTGPFCHGDSKAARTTVPGPDVSVWVPQDGARVTGRVAVKGWAYHPSGTVGGVNVWVDNQPVSLLNYQTGLYAPGACAGQPTGCNPYSGFKGFLDTWGLTEGPHELMVISVEDSDTTPGITIVRQGFVVDRTPPPSDTTPPTVSLTAPASGALLTGNAIIAANASDNVGVTKVEFYVDGVLKGTDTTAPFATIWFTTAETDGTHSITAKAYDARPNVTTSAAVTVTVDNTVPRLNIDAPAANTIVSGTSVALYGWATDASRIAALAFKLDGQPLALNGDYQYGTNRADVCSAYPGDPNCPLIGWYAFFDSTRFSSGTHTLEVVATDSAGLTASAQRAITINNDVSAPTVNVTAPGNSALVRGTVTLAANATDDVAVTKVEFYVDGALVGTDTTAPYTYAWNTITGGDGTHSLTAKAYDARPNVTTSAAVTVTVDNTAPRLSIDAPAANTTISGTSVSLYGWATDASRIDTLAFKLDGQPLALNGDYQYGTNRADVCSAYPGDPNCPAVGWYAFFDSTRFSAGTHTLEVVAADRAGLTASAQRTITINNAGSPPVVNLTAPGNGALVRGTVTFAANATDDVAVTKVEFYVDGVLKGTDTTAPYTCAWNSAAGSDGAHAITAKAYDSYPNVTTSAAVTVTVDNTVPRLNIDAPAANTTVSGTSVSLYGWATDTSRIDTLAFKLDGQPLALNGDYQYGTNRADVCSAYPGDPNCPLVGWYAFFDSTRFSAGTHTLEVVATDRAGLTASAQRTFTINN